MAIQPMKFRFNIFDNYIECRLTKLAKPFLLTWRVMQPTVEFASLDEAEVLDHPSFEFPNLVKELTFLASLINCRESLTAENGSLTPESLPLSSSTTAKPQKGTCSFE